MIDFCTSARDLPLTFVHYCSSSTARWRTSKSEKKTLKNLHQRTESQERLAGKVYALVNQWKPLSPPQIQNNWVSMAVTWILLSSLHIKPYMFKGYSNYFSFIPTPSIVSYYKYPPTSNLYTPTKISRLRMYVSMPIVRKCVFFQHEKNQSFGHDSFFQRAVLPKKGIASVDNTKIHKPDKKKKVKITSVFNRGFSLELFYLVRCHNSLLVLLILRCYESKAWKDIWPWNVGLIYNVQAKLICTLKILEMRRSKKQF